MTTTTTHWTALGAPAARAAHLFNNKNAPALPLHAVQSAAQPDAAAHSDSGSANDDGAPRRRRRAAPVPQHAKLVALHAQARREAERAHAAKRTRRGGGGAGSGSGDGDGDVGGGGAPRSRRRMSNIRSAEISRESCQQYIRLMENEIALEEQRWCDVLRDMLQLTQRTVELQRRIAARSSSSSSSSSSGGRGGRKRPRVEALDELLPVGVDGLHGSAPFAQWDNEADVGGGGDATHAETAVAAAVAGGAADDGAACGALLWCGWDEPARAADSGEAGEAGEAAEAERGREDGGKARDTSPVTVFRTAAETRPRARKRWAAARGGASPRSVRV